MVKFDQLIIEYNKRNIFLQSRKRRSETSARPLLVFQKSIKASGLKLSVNILQQLSTWHTIKTSCLRLQTTGPVVCSVLIFQKRVWGQFLHHVSCMIFQEKCLSCNIFLTVQNSLPDCPYFLKHCRMCIAIVCFPGCDVINFEINLIFLINLFFYMT